MPRLVVALSGPLGSGKSELATGLSGRFGTLTFSSSGYLRSLGASARPGQQALGDDLDRGGSQWLADSVASWLQQQAAPEDAVVVVDAIRREGQVKALRQGFGTRVLHLHLSARPDVLEARYQARAKARGGDADFALARAHATEAQVEDLARIADVMIDTSRADAEDVLAIAGHRLGLYARATDRLVDVLVGGQYGSEGKGNVVSYLAREYALLVRAGGPNAGHKIREAVRAGHPTRVIDDEDEPGDVYTHHHLPSGTRTSNAQILIAPGAVLRLDTFLQEVHDCGLDVDRLAIDPYALLIEPDVDVPAEATLAERIGSTAQGVGAAAARRIMARGSSIRFAKDEPTLRPYTRRWAVDVLEATFRSGGRVLLEGTQGAGLSIWHGAYPYVTSRDTTVAGTCAEAGIAPGRVRRVVMTCRTYPIRVQSPEDGWSGPLRWRPDLEGPTLWADASRAGEFELTEIARRSGQELTKLQATEITSTTKRRRRIGEFDWAWLHRTSQLNAPTDVALTFADYLGAANRKARRFDQLTDDTIRFVNQVEAVAEAPVSLISTGFSQQRIIDRRTW